MSEDRPESCKIELAVVSNDLKIGKEFPESSTYSFVSKCTATNNHSASLCISDSHAEEIVFVWMAERGVLLNADLNVNNDAVRDSSDLPDKVKRLIRIVCTDPRWWSPCANGNIFELSDVLRQRWERVGISKAICRVPGRDNSFNASIPESDGRRLRRPDSKIRDLPVTFTCQRCRRPTKCKDVSCSRTLDIV